MSDSNAAEYLPALMVCLFLALAPFFIVIAVMRYLLASKSALPPRER